jgi:hypothetical protein
MPLDPSVESLLIKSQLPARETANLPRDPTQGILSPPMPQRDFKSLAPIAEFHRGRPVRLSGARRERRDHRRLVRRWWWHLARHRDGNGPLVGLVVVDGAEYVIADIGMRMLVPRELATA